MHTIKNLSESFVENEALKHSVEVQGTGTRNAAQLWPGASNIAIRISS